VALAAQQEGEDATSRRSWAWLQVPGFVAVLAIAIATRFVNLPTRGMWDSDQGHDMLVLLAMVRDGVVPLVGPPTSIGDFHHGALYYLLLAPAAFASGPDPLAVVAVVAASGVAAVAVVWWLARSIAGPIAGFVAGLLMAVSASAIEESTFIWNPNLIALSSSVAFAAAWRAWTTWRTRWWLVAAAALAVTMQLHVLGAVLLVPFAALLIADARRTSSVDRGGVWQAAVGSVVVIALSYLPLIAYEVINGFPESRAFVAFLTGGGNETATLNPIARVVVVGLRALSWPLSGLITRAPLAAFASALVILAILAWRLRAGSGRERKASLWFGATLAWSIVLLAIAAPSLATVVEGLPNDHYHAFLDPIVFVLAGMGAAALWRARAFGRVLGTVVVAAAVAFNVATWPPQAAPDGGWPDADRAAQRIINSIGPDDVVLVGLPLFKPADAYAYPLARLGHEAVRPTDLVGPIEGTALVIPCDRLFETVMGSSCGGPAEDAEAAEIYPGWQLVSRFDASARTSISIYRAPQAAAHSSPAG
jgi:4-amino-4-deoxy-L-arabinose transferase-like glycosyltransferase